jgi:CelD/BcsL family acetyltransferase involved in cellulose biosynthesis
VKIDVLRPQELAAADLARWRELQQARPELLNPFLGPEFTLAVAAVKPRVQVAKLTEAGRVVGFFAFERGFAGAGRPIAAGVSDAQGVVAAADLQWDPQELLAACGLAVIEFDHLIGGQAPFEPYVRRREASPVLDLRDGFDAYVRARRSASRSFRRVLSRRRALAAEHPSLRFDFHRADDQTLSQLLAWKSAQYRRTGRRDRFAKPWIRGLLAHLMASDGEHFRGALACLSVDGRPIAIEACLVSERVLAMWFPAYSPGFERYSPGNVLRLELARAAAERGIGWLDMGKGYSVHKEIFKTGELQVAEACVRRPSPAAWLHRAYREPPRAIERLVLDHPRLRVAARQTLRRLGTLRGG